MTGSDGVKKVRDPGIDFIRVIACLIVIGTHVDVMGTGDSTKLLIRLLLSDGVTLFFVISGFFFFKKGFKETLKRSLTNIVLPGIVVMFLTYLFSPFIRGEKSIIQCLTYPELDLPGFITDVFSWGGGIRESLASHLWYIFTYLQLVLAYPLLKPLYTKDDRYRKYRWFIMVFIFINQIIMDLNMTGLISLLPVQVSPFMLYTTPAMLLMAGAELSMMMPVLKKSTRLKEVRIGAVVVFAVTLVLRFVMQREVFRLNSTQDFYIYWNCAFATVESISFIIFVLSFDFRDNKLIQTMARAGKYTFYIYLLHYGIYHMLFFRMGPDWSLGLIDLNNGYDTLPKEILHILIRVPTVFILSLAASAVIVRTGEFFKTPKK
ncbi:acyltransferase family protein [Oribacterium sp. FC2011]|uniref:acyltransferase family protein n=1 Tax=Oribacterium sp. FC2011 TaxID=1408311 RepID=UPI0004E194BC|nr:acyltransferase [Oribacterium sp. FC2011]